jgi:DivIVA domain-containing protein
LHLYVLAWALIGVGLLLAAPDVIKLTTGRARPQMPDPGARREAWSDLRRSLPVVAGGLSMLLGIPGGRAGPLRWLAEALLFAFVGWELVSWLRSRRAGKPDGQAGEDASRPDASASGEQPRPGTLPFPAVSASRAEVAEWVDRKTFSTTRLRPGYVQEEVDVFLDTIRDAFLAVRATALTSDEVRNIRFATALFRPGYDEEDVDTFLDYVQARLAT